MHTRSQIAHTLPYKYNVPRNPFWEGAERETKRRKPTETSLSHERERERERKKMGNQRRGETLLERLNVRVVGAGERVVVLSHGFGTDQSAWQRILPYLVRDHRVVLYDLVCAGSVNPDYFDFGRYTTLDAYADDLLDILDALRVERCAALVAHSVSAMIGVLAAIRRPALFAKLILIGASPRWAPSQIFSLFLF